MNTHPLVGFLAVGLLAAPTSGCLVRGGHHGHWHAHNPDPVEVAVVGGIVAVSAIAHASEEPPPPEPPPPAGPVVVATPHGAFDKGAAKNALLAVAYKDCGGGGEAVLSIEFSGLGKVRKIGFSDPGELAPEVQACVLGRFANVAVPPFQKASQKVAFRVMLPIAPAPAAPPVAPAPGTPLDL